MAVVARACQEREIARWIDDIPVPYGEPDARAYIALSRRGWKDSTLAAFAVTEAPTGEVLGSCGIHWNDHDHHVAEIGYWVKREARGRGVATRAVVLASRWAIEECGTERLQLRADVQNTASQRVAGRAGFQREGVLRSSRYSRRQGRRVDFVMYSLLPEDLGR